MFLEYGSEDKCINKKVLLESEILNVTPPSSKKKRKSEEISSVKNTRRKSFNKQMSQEEYFI